MKKYPSIEQYRNIIKQVRLNHDYKGKGDNEAPIYYHDTPYPTLTFEGTVKLHGTNAGVVLYKDGSLKFQSRERVLSKEFDNAGFYSWGENLTESDLANLFEGLDFKEYIAIYGEWCGEGVQKGVAISELPKMFVIFGCNVDGNWVDYERSIPNKSIYNIQDFKKYTIDIDFNNPEEVQNKLIEYTLEVEKECPVGEYFGVSGVGEGLVFTCTTNQDLKFKSKGEKHTVSKVKKLNPIDTEELESIKEFVEYSCTENRMKQGLENIPEIHQKYTGDFIKWVANDILKEEKDTLKSNNIDWKKAAGLVAKKCKEFLFKNI